MFPELLALCREQEKVYAPRTVARTVEDGRLAAADLTVRSVYVR